MFDRLARSWELVKASGAVLRADRELLVFPVVSAVLSVVVVATFVIPMVLAYGAGGGEDGPFPMIGYAVGFLFYVVQYTVIFFCNTALVGAAMIRLRGGDPTVGDGFRIAFERLGTIVGYAVIAATVGMVLRAISERSGFIGKIIVGIIGMAWSLATFLVVPVLVVEDVGPLEAVKRSAGYLRQTWGEQIVGNLGIGLVATLLSLGTLGVGVALLVLAASAESVTLVVVVIAAMVLAFVAIGLVSSALGGIYAAAVYRYAAEGQTGAFFSADMVRGAFREK